MQKALVLLAILVLASCQTVVPELPQQFKAKVVADLPFVGQVPGIFYYDYPNLRQRVDITQFGQYVIDLSMFAISTEYQIVSGQCSSQDLTTEMYPMTIPPFATYNGTAYLDNVPAQLWTADMLGVATLNYYISSVTQNGKVQNTLLKFYAELPGGIYVSYDFSAITVGPPDASFFDYTSFGCQSPRPPTTYTLSGYVKNAMNNRIISGATVQLSTGASATSGVDGLYSFSNVVAGVYNVTVPTNANFYGSTITVPVSADVPAGTIADFSLSPVLPSGQWRVVLTWGSVPSDLDSYFYTAFGQCTVYYRVRTCNQTTSWGTLDVDARNGYGPETVTLYNMSGTYKVNIYSSDGLYPQSKARVQVYNSSGLVQDIRVPTSGYNTNAKTWTVFTLNSNTLTLVNTFA